GAVTLTVNGAGSNQNVEFLMPMPTVTGVSPAGGAVGSQLQINGKGFGAAHGTSTAAINSVNAPVVSWSDTQVVVTVPTGAATGAATVTEGGVQSNQDVSFTVGSVVVNSVSPKAGPTGTQVTISGSGFGASQGTLTFNNTAATSISSWSDAQIV